MATYRGFSYSLDPRKGSWTLVFPNGQKLVTPPQSEDELKAAIDAYVAGLGAQNGGQ